MKHIFQFALILGISFLGEVFNRLIPLPIPGSIYGLVLMFILLATRIIPLDAVRGTGKFLIEIMPVMFIPPAVSFMANLDVVKTMLTPLILAGFATTFIVLAASGLVTQAVIRKSRKNKAQEVEK